MFKKYIPWLGISLLFSACNNPSPSEKALTEDTLSSVAPLSREGVIEYDIVTLKKSAVHPKNKQKIIAEVHLKYPVLRSSNIRLNNSVKLYVENFISNQLKANTNAEDTSKTNSISASTKAFIKTCKSSIADQLKQEPEMDHVWYCDVIGNVEMQSGNYLTIRFKFNSYTGGSHGNYGEDYATFNIKTGMKLIWTDVLAEKDKFLKLAELRFKQMNGLDARSKLTEDEGFSFENNKFSLPNNFGLSNEGLVVYYQPYEVAPYSFGSTILIFKYYEISAYLNPQLFEEMQ